MLLLVNFVWFKITQDISFTQLLQSNFGSRILIYEIVIGLLIFMIIISMKFITRYRDSEREVQKAKQESAKFQYETLKNQINPHFLFYSLNVLSALIYKDANKADEFTVSLSRIYHYILDHQDDELVPLSDEIQFIKQYAYLQNIRFDQNFKIEIAPIEELGQKLIIPMALQLLVENVFKHNVVSEQEPMLVNISFGADYVEVKNTLNSKRMTEPSHQIGLKNIENRYRLLTEQACVFDKTEKDFIVRIPLLNALNE